MKARLHSTVFGLLCLLGAAASIGLTVHEVAKTAPVSLTVAHTSRIGSATLVTVGVTNRTSVDRCLTVRVAARDRDGHDLATAVAARRLSVPAHARRTVQVRLTLTARQYAEKLHAFYPSQQACVP